MIHHSSESAAFCGFIALFVSVMLVRALAVRRIEFKGRPSIERDVYPKLYWQWCGAAMAIAGAAIVSSLFLLLS